MTLPKRILAAVDFSLQSQAVIDQACALADQGEADLHILHVNPHLNGSPESQETKRVALERIGKLVRPADESEIRTTKVVQGGQPHRTIAAYADKENIDLIVMGTHGRTGLSHLALGSVAERVMRHALCPVQVIKSRPLDDTPLDIAAEAIAEKYGETLQGELAETEAALCATIAAALNLTETAAEDMLGELKQREWVTWTSPAAGEEQGSWRFVTGIEFLEDTSDFVPSATNSPATDLVIRARQLRATDIHVDPASSGESRVRFRIDGQLEEYCRLDQTVCEHLVNQWKLMAGLDVADPFRPKEGRVSFPASATELADVEARFTSAPVANGEAIALRLFRRSDLYIPLSGLGFSPSAMHAIDAMLSDAEGLILVSGPTGSGKTTTVYSMLESISSANRNIVSIEDPVEFPVPFVRQMAVNERHGIHMTQGLKTLLRMDPDIIFLGEIRDAAAADIAMQAAASGRYVFSTLHSRDIPAVFTTMRDFGLADRSLAANIAGVVNQRLTRRLCTQCRCQIPATDELKQRCDTHGLDLPEFQYERVGCQRCRGTGYRGRVGIFEAISLSPDIRGAIAAGQSETTLRSLIRENRLVSLEVAALSKVAQGITDADEVGRVHWV